MKKPTSRESFEATSVAPREARLAGLYLLLLLFLIPPSPTQAQNASLSLALPSTVTERGGSKSGNVIASVPPSTNLIVDLWCSSTNDLRLPPTATIPAGETSAVFTLSARNNDVIDGSRLVTVTASASGWEPATTNLTVLDDEYTNIILSVTQPLQEGNGLVAGAGRVRLLGTALTNITVSLQSSDTTAIIVPPSVVVTQGQSAVYFDVTVVDDDYMDGTQVAIVTASAIGFASSSLKVAVKDNEVHHLRFPIIGEPQYFGVPFKVTVVAETMDNELIPQTLPPLILSATNSAGVILYPPVQVGTFSNSIWSGSITLTNLSDEIVFFGICGSAQGVSNPFEVQANPVHELALPSKSLVYDRFSARIYATVPADGGSYSNQVVGIDPLTKVIDRAISLNPDPQYLALSDDGQFLYSGVSNGLAVQRVSLNTLTTAPPFAVGATICDMEVQPSNPDVLVVVRLSTDISAYERGVRLPNSIGPYSYVEFSTNANLLYSYGGAGANLVRVSVTSNGLERIVPWLMDVCDWGTEFEVDGDIAYYGSGRVVDATTMTLLGQYPGITAGLVCPDTRSQRVFYLQKQGSAGTISAYMHRDPVLLRSLNVPNVKGIPGNLIRWGEGGLAFRTTSNQLFLISANVLLPTNAPADVACIQELPSAWNISSNYTVTIIASNSGPNRATDVQLLDTLPPSTIVVGGTATKGQYTNAAGTVFWKVGRLSPGESARMQLVLNSTTVGWLQNKTMVLANENDPNPVNNQQIMDISIQLPNSSQCFYMELATSDLVYDPIGQRLLASIPSSVPVRSNTIAILDPFSAALTTSVPVGLNPSRMLLSRDNKYLYVVVSNEVAVQRFDMPGLAPGLCILRTTNLTILDLAVSPVDSSTIAICFSDGGVRIYNNATDFTEADFNATQIEYDDFGKLYGGTDMKSGGNVMYDTRGSMYAVPTLTPVKGMAGSSPTSRLICPSPELNRLYCVSRGPFYYDPWVITAFDRYSSVALGTYTPPGVAGTPLSLIRWGLDGLALNASGGRVVIMRGILMPTNPPADLEIQVQTTPQEPLAGSNFLQTIIITNKGPANASGVVVTVFMQSCDILGGTNASGTCTLMDSSTLTCNISVLSNGCRGVLEVGAKAKSGQFDNIVTAVSTAGDPIPENNLIWRWFPSGYTLGDSDGDNMPDTWEQANGFNPFDPRDADLDSDQDGRSNYQEYLSGTNPREPYTVLLMYQPILTDQGLEISFPSVPGRLYQMETSDTLPLTNWVTMTNLVGIAGKQSIRILNTNSSGFYRVKCY